MSAPKNLKSISQSIAAKSDTPVSIEAASPKPSKTATVIDLLRRKDGAILGDLVAATGWLPHTIRAALTGLRKNGHVIDKAKIDGVTTYRIASAV